MSACPRCKIKRKTAYVRSDITLIVWVLAELFVPLHRRRCILLFAVVGVFIHIDCTAQTEGASPFNTVGYNYRKPRANVESKAPSSDEFEDVIDEDDVMSPPVDSLRAYMPMVAYPLRAMHVTSPFGIRKDPMDKRRKRMHSGLDLRARYENVYSMLPGQVTAASYSENGGYYVSIDHGICVCSYLHLSKVMARKGQRINAGQLIAISGNSGKRSTGPHLHISCRWIDGKYFDPMLILKFVTEQLSNNK